MSTRRPYLSRAFSILVSLLGITCAFSNSIFAQSATLPLHLPFTTIADEQGNDPTDPASLLFRRGTDLPITDRNGNQITFGQYDDVQGEVILTARPEGGTDITITATNLLPEELYTVWAGYWTDPGHPAGNRIAFGAASKDNAGTDNWAFSDKDGNISFNVVQEAGPMTVQKGEAPAYAPMSPIVDEFGELKHHAGYAIGIANHFGDYPKPDSGPWIAPGPGSTWSLHGLAEFKAVPEPSSLVLLVIGVAALGFRRKACK